MGADSTTPDSRPSAANTRTSSTLEASIGKRGLGGTTGEFAVAAEISTLGGFPNLLCKAGADRRSEIPYALVFGRGPNFAMQFVFLGKLW